MSRRTPPTLCFVTDGARGTGGRPLADVANSAVRGGVDLIVIRERDLPDAELAKLCTELGALRSRGARVVVSRRLDLARACDLDGVHLAADAVGVAEARRWLGPDAFIGYSAHSRDEARSVATQGASYVTLSPIYPTQSKPGAAPRGAEWLRAAVDGLAIPALALGGVTPERVREVCAAGASGAAAVSAIGAAPDPEAAARAFRSELKNLALAMEEEAR